MTSSLPTAVPTLTTAAIPSRPYSKVVHSSISPHAAVGPVLQTDDSSPADPGRAALPFAPLP